ncbi:hypothetical protein BH11BAC2_BH11BAC2_17670 [soil metagenome]
MIIPRQVFKLSGHKGPVYALEQGADPWQIFSAGSDRIVAEWDLRNPAEGKVLVKATDLVYALRYLHEDQKLLIGNGSGGMHIVNLQTRQEERLLQLHQSGIFFIGHHPVHQLIFTLAADGTCAVLQQQDLTLIRSMKFSEGKLRSISFHPDHKSCAIGCGDGSIMIFSLPELLPLHHWQAHQEGFSVNTVCFTPDGAVLLSGSRDAHLNRYATKDYSLLESIPAHNYAIYDLAFSPDNLLLASASRDKTVKIWDANTMELQHRIDRDKFQGHQHSVNKLLWTTYQNMLLSAGDDRNVMGWSLSEA